MADRRGFRLLSTTHYETLCGRYDLHKLHGNGPIYLYDNRDESRGLDPLEWFWSWPEAFRRTRELLG